MAVGRKVPNQSVVIYLYAESRPGLVEGTVYLRKKKPGTRTYVIDRAIKEEHFDSLDAIPAKIQKLFNRKAKGRPTTRTGW
jgi:hypothetical protein